MRKGIESCGTFLLFLSSGCLGRPFVRFELQTALELEKQVVLVHEADKQSQRFDFVADKELCPASMRYILDEIESLPFRRRGYERDSMLNAIIKRAGYQVRYASAQDALAELPMEVPLLPVTYVSRGDAEAALQRLLLQKRTADSGYGYPLIKALGMGGSGKTALATSLVRSEPVRKRYYCIVWVNIGMESTLFQLQSLILEQLTGFPLGEGDVDTKTNTKRLRKATREAIGSILLVLDDLWLDEQEQALNCIHPENGSKVLITTRIRDVVPMAHTVDLSLMSKQAAASLLMRSARMDEAAATPPPAAFEISAACGYLPLTIVIAGNIVRTFGSGWEESVPKLLSKKGGVGASALRRKRSTMGGSASVAEQSTEDRVISVGLQSLSGADAPRIRALFAWLAVIQEDVIVPIAAVEQLWKAQRRFSSHLGGTETEAEDDANDAEDEDQLAIRGWLSTLLGRSLLLGSMNDGIKIHDLVLDYIRSLHSEQELRDGHRRFVDTLLKFEPFIATNVKTPVRGGEVSWFISHYLGFHMKSSVSGSGELQSESNAHIRGWLDTTEQVEKKRLLCMAVGADGLNELGEHASSTGDWWSASQRWKEAGVLLKTFTRFSPAEASLNKAQEAVQKIQPPTVATKSEELMLIGLASACWNMANSGRYIQEGTEVLKWLTDRTGSASSLPLQLMAHHHATLKTNSAFFTMIGGEFEALDSIIQGMLSMVKRFRAVEKQDPAAIDQMTLGSMLSIVSLHGSIFCTMLDKVTPNPVRELADVHWYAQQLRNYDFAIHHKLILEVQSVDNMICNGVAMPIALGELAIVEELVPKLVSTWVQTVSFGRRNDDGYGNSLDAGNDGFACTNLIA